MFVLLEDVGRLIAVHENDGIVAAFALRDDAPPEPTGASLTVPGAAFVTPVSTRPRPTR
ncbi:hypothetical protein [Sphingomonas sp. DT-204]|uniref:hypothetical protein n=1 Tax=Sphingomonas sp. DT-204 TaxID=3396166 RepID=UPI003F1CB465